MTTPNNITKLKENQIFVFGSNLNGNHAGGAARLAKDSFGAQDGVGEGLTGQSYAFPTLDTKMKKVSKKALTESKTKLYKCAEENQDKQFLVTKLGCGIAGFSEEEMKKIFAGDKPNNIILPAGWAVIRGYKAFNKKCSKEKWDNANKPSWLYFNLTEWVYFSDMTDEEKEKYPSCKTTGGYLKKLDYKEAFKKSFDNASKEEQQKIKKLPNWNKKVFFEISGIMID